MPLAVQTVSNGIIIAVKIVPNSSRDQIVGLLGNALKIKVAQPPEGGRANRAVERLLAQACGLPASSVKVVAGETNAQKRVLLIGGTAGMIEKLAK